MAAGSITAHPGRTSRISRVLNRTRAIARRVLFWARKVGRERIGTFRLLFVVRLLQWPLRACSRPFLRRLPRDRRLIAFGAGSDRFADNSAYLFLHMSNASDLRCVWVSGSRSTVERLKRRDLDAVYRWSPQGVWVALRASWYVFSSYRSDINMWLGDGAVAFNLWHGIGVKRIQRDRSVGAGSVVYTAPEGTWTARVFADDRRSPDWVLSTSPMMSTILSRAFDVARDRCVELGYPRNDHLVESNEPPDALVDRATFETLATGRPVIGYFPTFRDNSVSLPGGVPLITEMAAIVAAQGGTFVFKAHDATLLSGTTDVSWVTLPRDADLNSYLGLCDVLITDYSSVVTDYLVLARPVVLFCPDLDEYQDNRGFALDPLEMMPGIVVRTTAELYEVLNDFRSVPVSNDTRKLVELYWGDSARSGACTRVEQFIRDHSNPFDGFIGSRLMS